MTPAAFSLQRQDFLDCLRGFALLGILLVNVKVFSSPFYGSGLPNPMSAGVLDRALDYIVGAVFETKFYLLFSLLFGYSFTIQMMSAECRNRSFSNSFLRRLLGLLLIGLLHAILLYIGDILMIYALTGLLLLGMRRCGDRTLTWLSAAVIMATALLWTCLILFEAAGSVDAAGLLAGIQEQTRRYQGGWPSVLAENLRVVREAWPIMAMLQGPMAFAMFCLGLIAGRRQLFLHLDAYRPWLRRMAFWGLLVGAPAALLYGYAATFLVGTIWEGGALILTILTGPLLVGLYCVLALKAYRGAAGGVMRFLLAPAGRMALSNYLLQSLACVFLFYGVGLGLIGRVSSSATYAIALMLYLSQCLLSRLWLKRFQYGPAEWLLRSFTHWRWAPLRSAVGS